MGKRTALIVATYEYDDPELRQLTAPRHDAEDLVALLRDPSIGGFDDVLELINQPHTTVGEAIGDFYTETRPNDLTLMYFSGHGLKDDSGRLYLAMKDTRLHKKLWTSVTADHVEHALADSASRQKILVLDCCYAGAFPSGLRAKADNAVHVLEKFSGRGRIVLTASDATQFAFEGDTLRGGAPQSVFTRHLIAGIRDGTADRDQDGDITVDELYDYVHQRVTEERPQQRPKMDASVSGRTVIAHNVNWSLPHFVQNLLQSPFADIRLQALQHLGDYFKNGNQAVRRKICHAVEELRDNEDSRAVEKAANDWLDEHRMTVVGSPPIEIAPKTQPPKATEEPMPSKGTSISEADQPPEQEIHAAKPPQEQSAAQAKFAVPSSAAPPERRVPDTNYQTAPWWYKEPTGTQPRGYEYVGPTDYSQPRTPPPTPPQVKPEDLPQRSRGTTPAGALGRPPQDRTSSPRPAVRPNTTFTRPAMSPPMSSGRSRDETRMAAAAHPAASRTSPVSGYTSAPREFAPTSDKAPDRKWRWYLHPAALLAATGFVALLAAVIFAVWPSERGTVEEVTTTTAIAPPPPPPLTQASSSAVPTVAPQAPWTPEPPVMNTTPSSSPWPTTPTTTWPTSTTTSTAVTTTPTAATTTLPTAQPQS